MMGSLVHSKTLKNLIRMLLLPIPESRDEKKYFSNFISSNAYVVSETLDYSHLQASSCWYVKTICTLWGSSVSVGVRLRYSHKKLCGQIFWSKLFWPSLFQAFEVSLK